VQKPPKPKRKSRHKASMCLLFCWTTPLIRCLSFLGNSFQDWCLPGFGRLLLERMPEMFN
jgi:hypothetical protein